MLKIRTTNRFEKDLKKAQKSGCDLSKLKEVILMLQNGIKLPFKNKDHFLVNYEGMTNVRECHIEPDWLLIYKIESEITVLHLIRTGTHSNLF